MWIHLSQVHFREFELMTDNHCNREKYPVSEKREERCGRMCDIGPRRENGSWDLLQRAQDLVSQKKPGDE